MTNHVISIHAPRGGSDKYRFSRWFSDQNFNPRSPWGERLVNGTAGYVNADFNPRSPWGERRPLSLLRSTAGRFQSTLPVGGATVVRVRYISAFHQFQSTLPVGGATSPAGSCLSRMGYFNPRSPWGERHDINRNRSRNCFTYFNPRSPWGERHHHT